MLPNELIVRSTRRELQNQLKLADYTEAMITELDELDEIRLNALDYLRVQNNWATRAYNKRVKAKSFCTEDLVWKAVLPLGEKNRRYGKWSIIGKDHLLSIRFSKRWCLPVARY